MNKRIMKCLLTALVLAAGTGIAWAEEEGEKVVPVELYACKYNDTMGPADLEKVIGKWTSWADEQGMENYAAWTLTPWPTSARITIVSVPVVVTRSMANCLES